MSFNMKITFGMIVLNGDQVLEETLASVYPYAHQILIAEGPVAYWRQQGYTTSTDGTNEILDSFPDPENKIKIVHSQYLEKDDQCNTYMQHLDPNSDYIWNLDCDEVFKSKDIETVIGLLETERYTSVGFKSLTFYGGFDNYLTGFEENAEFMRIRKVYPGSYWKTHRPPTIAHKINNPWPEKHLGYNYLNETYGVRMYHYSYVFPDQVFNKIKYYEEFLNKTHCIKDYFNQVYLPWVTGSDEQRKNIEQRYLGVHEWTPGSRGECYSAPFTLEHPEIIKSNLEQLKDKFNKQLMRYLP
jgi:glycosyltransferase involved in cell wall biosynthesis